LKLTVDFLTGHRIASSDRVTSHVFRHGKVAETRQTSSATRMVQQRQLHQSSSERLATSRRTVVTECRCLLRR